MLDAANRAVQAIVALPQPVVAVVQGPAAGVGVSLALACDVVLASEKAFFMLAFTKIGLMPDGGASALIAAAIGRIRAMRMALLAERVPAAEAQQWGLVTAVYSADDFDAEVDKVIATLVSGPAVALRKTKHAINASTLTELEAALGRESQGQLALLQTDDFREGTRAFQEHRRPTSPAPDDFLLRERACLIVDTPMRDGQTRTLAGHRESENRWTHAQSVSDHHMREYAIRR